MRPNELIMDKFTAPQHNLLYIGMQVHKEVRTEIHIDTLIERVLRRRKNARNISDEIRVIKAIGLLIGLGVLGYYKGYVYKP